MKQSTSRSQLTRKAVRLVVGLVVTSFALVACGDDDKKSAEATHEEWFEAACDKLAGLDPGFDAFFEATPEPTLADWAAFIPTPIAFFDNIIAAANLPHPAEDDAYLSDVIAAVEKLQGTYRATIDAAEAGDQAAFDLLEAQVQDTDLPAVFELLDQGEDCPD